MDTASTANASRWKNYVLFNSSTISDLWNLKRSNKNKNVLYILGSGFDIRMTTGLSTFLSKCPTADVTCLLISYANENPSQQNNNKAFLNNNLKVLETLIPASKIIQKVVPIYAQADKDTTARRYVGDVNSVTHVIANWQELEGYDDVYLDISSLSRGVYISLAGKILSILDADVERQKKTNFFILATENAAMDALILEEGLVGPPQFLRGFSLSFNSIETIKPLLWLPILGEHKQTYLQATYEELESKKQKLEICPVLPFPSRDPRRSDNLFEEHRQALFDELTIDFKDVLYVPEQNPYEVYLGLARTIARFNGSMKLLDGCRVAISPFSSKLLSVGAMLVSYELKTFRGEGKIDVGIMTTVSESYAPVDQNLLNDYHKDSEIFVIWVAGEPYIRPN